MARTAAISGKGTTLSIAPDSAGSAGSYTDVGEVIEISQPAVNSDLVDATHFTSDSDFGDTISTGWKKGDDVPFKINYVKAQASTLYGAVGTYSWFKITLPDGSTYVFPGYLTKFGGDPVAMRDRITTSGNMQLAGDMIFTAGS